MLSRLVRVFISSTFRDFIHERDELVKKVFPELRKRCKERFVELLEVDLRWGITEEQAKGGETLRICLEEIDRCRPSAPVFFIGLLGERYGWIPPKEYFTEEILEDPKLAWVKEHIEGKSVTELEILHGVLRNKEMREKAFFYFRNNGYQDRHWQEIQNHHKKIHPPITKEDFTNARPESRRIANDKKQCELKQSIQDASLTWDPRNYETPEEMGRAVLDDLWSAIDRVFPAGQIPSEHERQRLEHDAFGQSRTKGYVQRAGLFKKLDLVFSEKQCPVVVVTGDSGGGKSALLAAWFEQLGVSAPSRRFVHYIGGTSESSSAKSIVFRLMDQIRLWGDVGEPIPENLDQAVQALPEWLAKATKGQKRGVLLVLDALNQLESARDRSLWWLPRQLPAGIRLVVSTLPGESENELQIRGWLGNKVNVPPLNDQERKQIIHSYLGRFTKKLDNKLVERLAHAPQASNPLFLRVVLDELRTRGRHEELESMLAKMLEAKDPSELFIQVLKNLEEFDKERKNLVREAMGFLAVARRGLSEDEILQLLSNDLQPSNHPLARHYWSPLYLALEDSLVSRNGQLSFFHDYLKKAVEAEYLDEAWERENVHNRLGGAAIAYDSDIFSPSLKRYGLAHGAWHLRRANNLESLWTLLSDEYYRRAQLEELGSSRYVLEGLTEGVDAYADQGDPGIESDIRLATLAATRAEVQENERFITIPKAFEELAAAPSHDIQVISRILAHLNILNGGDHFFACQIILLVVGCNKKENRSFEPCLEMILEAMEQKVARKTDVEILPGVAEVLAKFDNQLILRFVAVVKMNRSFISKCAEIKLEKGDLISAVLLAIELLPKAVNLLASQTKQEEALELIRKALESPEEGSSENGRKPFICLESLGQLGPVEKIKKRERILEKCVTYIPRVTDDSVRVQCWILTEKIKGGLNGLNNADGFDQASLIARSMPSIQKRFSSFVKICCALIEAGQTQRAWNIFEPELELFSSSVKPGDEVCTFIWDETEGLAKILCTCATESMIDRWMSVLTRSIYDPGLMNTNGLYIGTFSEALSEVIRKIYRKEDSGHRNWIPQIVETIYSERPSSELGEIKSLAACALARIAAAIGLSTATEKSSLLHHRARCETLEAYKETGENEFLECAREAVRSGQVTEALAYVESYEQQERIKEKNVDWVYGNLAEALGESGHVDEAIEILEKKATSADGIEKGEWTRPALKLIQNLCEKGRSVETDKLLPLVKEPSSGFEIDALIEACRKLAESGELGLLEALWGKAGSLRAFVPSFLAAQKIIDPFDSAKNTFLQNSFDLNYSRLKGRPEEASTLALLSQSLTAIGRHKDAVSAIVDAYRSASGRDSLRSRNNLEEILAQNTGNNSGGCQAQDWNDPKLHDQCLAHLSVVLAESKLVQFGGALLSQIRNRKIWLKTFRTICGLLKNRDSEAKECFLESAWPILIQSHGDKGIPTEGIIIKSPDLISNTDGIAHAAASIAQLGRYELARTLILKARSSIESHSSPFWANEIVPAALQAGCCDVALEVMIEGLELARNMQHSVDRGMHLTEIIGMIPQFQAQKDRRCLFAKTLSIARQIWRNERNPDVLSDIIYALTYSGELRSAIILEKIYSKRNNDLGWSNQTKALIASKKALHGNVKEAEKILMTLPDSHCHTEAWVNVALGNVLQSKHEAANRIYHKISSVIFTKTKTRALTEEFLPVFRTILAQRNNTPPKAFFLELMSHPVACASLWEPILSILSHPCFEEKERSQLKERFAKDCFLELGAVNSVKENSSIRQLGLIELCNAAIKHLIPDSGWVERLKAKTGGSAFDGLHLGKIDFDGRLPWIRAFFALCSASPTITKMQITALIASYGAAGRLDLMSAVARGLPQTDLWEALRNAAVAMNRSASKQGGPSSRKLALEASIPILGHGHESVVKLADSIQQWPDREAKLSYYRKATQSAGTLYGKKDSNYWRAANKLGITLFEDGAYQEALSFFTSSYDWYLHKFGSDSDKTLSSLFNCGLARRKLDQLIQSAHDLQSVVEGRRRLFGDADPRTLRALDEFAETCISQQNLKVAEEALIEAVRAVEPPKDTEDPGFWRSMVGCHETQARRFSRLGLVQMAQKKFHEAKASAEESIKNYNCLINDTRVKSPQKEKYNRLCLRAHSLLAEALAGLGKLSEAVLIQESVVKGLQGFDQIEAFEAELDLSSFIFRSGDYSSCERLLSDLMIRAKANSKINKSIFVTSAKGLARCWAKQGLATKALAMLRLESEKSEELARSLRPTLIRMECLAGNPETAKTLALEELASDPESASKIKSVWLADTDFEVIHDFLKNKKV